MIEPGVILTEFGDVLMDPMLERSGGGPYADLARKVAKATRAAYESGDGSPASVIAGTISRALKARRPKTRYVAGKYAKMLIGLRKWFGDRAFDRGVMRQFSGDA